MPVRKGKKTWSAVPAGDGDGTDGPDGRGLTLADERCDESESDPVLRGDEPVVDEQHAPMLKKKKKNVTHTCEDYCHRQ
jgi:hypothetical protein